MKLGAQGPKPRSLPAQASTSCFSRCSWVIAWPPAPLRSWGRRKLVFLPDVWVLSNTTPALCGHCLCVSTSLVWAFWITLQRLGKGNGEMWLFWGTTQPAAVGMRREKQERPEKGKGNEIQKGLVVVRVGGELPWGQSPSPVSFGRFG